MGLYNYFFGNTPEEERDLTFQQLWGADIQSSSIYNAGRSVENSLSFVAVFACVRLLSETIAGLPLDTYRKTTGLPKELRNPIWLDTPNKETTRFEFIEQIVTSLTLWGNAYVLKLEDNVGSILELWVLNPAHVTPFRNGSNDIDYRVGTQTIPGRSVIHFKGFSMPGELEGLSPVSIARQAVNAGLSTDKYAVNFWENGAHPSGVIEVPDKLKDEDVKVLRRAWNSQHQGSKNAYKTAILTSGANYSPISIPADNAQFLQTRKFQVNEIARLFRVPPHMIGDLERSTNNNIEHQGIEFVQYTLAPWLSRIEDKLSLQLPRGQYVKFNEKALLRGDTSAQSESLRTAWEHGAISINEWREKLDQEPIDGGDSYFVPLNFVELTKALAPEPQPEQEPNSEDENQ